MASPFDKETKTLSFLGQALKLNSEVDARPVADQILAAEPLEVLCMQGCTVAPDAAKEIAKAMESKGDLKRMQFQDMFTGRLKQEIPLCLRYFGSGMDLAGARLVELNLSDNAIGPIGSEGLVPIIRSEVCYTLKELRLNNTGLGPTGSTMVAEALMDCFKSSSDAGKPIGLRVFIAGRSRLENVGATLFAEVFAKMGTLEEISVPQNGIFPEGIKALSEALAKNPNMRTINFEDNIVKPEGIRDIGKALKKLENVEELNLGDGLVKTRGAFLLADALRETPSKLKSLNLSSNEIHLEGGIAVVEGLEGHAESLEILNLDGNFFGDSGAEEVAARVDSVGLAKDCLVPFEENVEPDSEEEAEEIQTDQESEEEEEEGEIKEEVKKVNGNVQEEVEDFLEYPSVDRFQKLADKSIHRLQSAMSTLYPYVDAVEREVELVARVSSAVNETNRDTKEAKTVLETAKKLIAMIFHEKGSSGDIGDHERRTELLLNHFLVCLGLLKHENKKWTMEWRPEGLLFALAGTAREGFFPGILRSSLQLFLGRPTHLDQYKKAKTELLRNVF